MLKGEMKELNFFLRVFRYVRFFREDFIVFSFFFYWRKKKKIFVFGVGVGRVVFFGTVVLFCKVSYSY